MQPTTVIVVEDDPFTRMDAVTLIEEAGFDVVDMESADQALTYIWRQPMRIAALFSDVNTLGHTNGADLARMVSCHWPRIMLLVTSGHDPKDMQLPMSSRFLPKPWKPLDVLNALMGTEQADR